MIIGSSSSTPQTKERSKRLKSTRIPTQVHRPKRLASQGPPNNEQPQAKKTSLRTRLSGGREWEEAKFVTEGKTA